MIYLAGLVDGLGSLAGIVLLVLGLALCTGGSFYTIHASIEEERNPLAESLLKRGAITWLIIALVGTILPSSKTIYAIAASEYGEEILKSDTANKAVKALDAWLDRQIAGEKE